MASLNKVMLIGNLGKESPEVRYTAAGTAVASFSIATSEKFKNKSGGMGRENRVAQHHPFGPGGPRRRSPGNTRPRGRPSISRGACKTRKWQDKDGRDRYTTEIVGEKMQMLSGKGEGGGGRQGGGRGESQEQPGTRSRPSTRMTIFRSNLGVNKNCKQNAISLRDCGVFLCKVAQTFG